MRPGLADKIAAGKGEPRCPRVARRRAPLLSHQSRPGSRARSSRVAAGKHQGSPSRDEARRAQRRLGRRAGQAMSRASMSPSTRVRLNGAVGTDHQGPVTPSDRMWHPPALFSRRRAGPARPTSYPWAGSPAAQDRRHFQSRHGRQHDQKRHSIDASCPSRSRKAIEFRQAYL